MTINKEIWRDERKNPEAKEESVAGRRDMVKGYIMSPHGQRDFIFFRMGLEHFSEAHRLDPQNPHYTLSMADALFALGRSDEAMAYYNNAVSHLKPDSEHLAGVRRRWIR